jgi:RNA polymerase sigma factor (sigma-70 family)
MAWSERTTSHPSDLSGEEGLAMADADSAAVLRHARVLFGAGAVGGATDGQLLERFNTRGAGGAEADAAEAAFAVLLARHGPMVLGVCRRALRDPADVADAFQATFLVLLRKAGSVRVDDSLGRWLYGVSRKVASRARSDAARRAARDGTLSSDPITPPHDPERAERLEALDEEVARLPAPFRSAVVLCDLGGLTHEAAARQLGCPVGTIESRLSRGRRRLRERLTRRGLAPSAVAPGLGLALPAVPEALSASTVQAAFAAGSRASVVSSLIEGVIKDMAWTRLKMLAMGFGALAAACGVGVFAAERIKDDDPPKQTEIQKKAELVLQPPARMKPGDILQIEVLEALPGRPISGERLVRPDGTISLGFYGDLKVAGLDRNEIKVKLIEHLRKFLPDEVLGLETVTWVFPADTSPAPRPRPAEDGIPRPEKVVASPLPPATVVKIAPADSDRVFVDDSPIYRRKPASVPLETGTATTVKPGDRLLIEVLVALQGRPISGERLVRPDGTISLGFYGDIKVAGLTREEIKVKVVEHLKTFLTDADLGLVETDRKTGKPVKVAPADTTRVLVQDDLNLWPDDSPRARSEKTLEKLEQILKAIEAKAPRGNKQAPPTPRQVVDHETRLFGIERKLDRLIKAVEGLKGK